MGENYGTVARNANVMLHIHKTTVTGSVRVTCAAATHHRFTLWLTYRLNFVLCGSLRATACLET